MTLEMKKSMVKDPLIDFQVQLLEMRVKNSHEVKLQLAEEINECMYSVGSKKKSQCSYSTNDKFLGQ